MEKIAKEEALKLVGDLKKLDTEIGHLSAVLNPMVGEREVKGTLLSDFLLHNGDENTLKDLLRSCKKEGERETLKNAIRETLGQDRLPSILVFKDIK